MIANQVLENLGNKALIVGRKHAQLINVPHNHFFICAQDLIAHSARHMLKIVQHASNTTQSAVLPYTVRSLSLELVQLVVRVAIIFNDKSLSLKLFF